MSLRGRLILTIAVLALGLGGGIAAAERVQQGNVQVILNGGLTPNLLPRDHRAPVAVELSGGVHTSDGSPIPRVNWIRLELAWGGELDRRGLMVCPQSRLISTDNRQAIAACGGARVGDGKLYAEIFVPNQKPFGVHAHLIAFNGQTKEGRPAVLVHAYSTDPPVSFIIPFTVHHRTGRFRTVLVTTIRRSVGPWPHVSSFRIHVSRNFHSHGQLHSYLSASCTAPPPLHGGVLSLAQATYTFAGGAQQTVDTVRSCHVRE